MAASVELERCLVGQGHNRTSHLGHHHTKTQIYRAMFLSHMLEPVQAKIRGVLVAVVEETE